MTNMSNRCALRWLKIGTLFAGLAVVLGAFAAHGLGDFLLRKYAGMTKEVLGQSIPAASKYLADFKTAAEYQMSHSLALVAVGLLAWHRPGRSLNVAGGAFLLGILLFSGSLYLLVLTGITKLGAITPIGGVLFLIGWGAMFFSLRKDKAPPA
jgi:uncharacterized membrane protein YgdD (TMEM256/DUF423 family)